MKNSTGLSIFILAISLAILTGCQAGKFRKPAFVDNLAFWNKESKLNEDYIEPPSAMFTPTDTDRAVATKSDGPPKRPDSGIQSDVELFNRKVADSYRKLSAKSDASVESTNQGLQSLISEASRNVENAVAASGDAAFKTLTPRSKPKTESGESQQLTANADSTSQIPTWQKPIEKTPAQLTNQTVQGPLTPAVVPDKVSTSPNLPKTRYAKNADVKYSNDAAKISNPYSQSTNQSKESTSIKVANTPVPGDKNQILNPYFSNNQPPAAKDPGNIAARPNNNRVANPYYPKTNSTPESTMIEATQSTTAIAGKNSLTIPRSNTTPESTMIAAAPPAPATAENSLANPNSMIPVEVGASNNLQASYNGYPITPHKPFLPRKVDTDNSPATNAVRVASLPSSLLQGQGTYAPGSVKAPDGVLPVQVPGGSKTNQ